jgi:hypothetical protein
MNFKYKVLLILGALLFVFGGGYLLGNRKVSELDTYNRQLQGQLSDQERELQKSNSELGISKSELMTQKQLATKLKSDNEEYSRQLQSYIKRYNLEIASRDETIAELKQQLSGGSSEVVVGNDCNLNNPDNKCVLAYSWEDQYKRFKLADPNVFQKNNEVFTSKQTFKIYGEVYKQKNGSLETRRVVLREIHKKEDNTYEEIPNAKADVLDAKFEYTSSPNENTARGVVRPRVIGFGTVGITPDIGTTQLGAGMEFLNYKNFGLSTGFGLDFESLKKSELKVGIEYNPSFLNLGFGVFGGTPVDGFVKEYTLSTGLIFYITN